MSLSTAPDAAGDLPVQQPSRITLAGGCFWCTEAVFDRVEGVLDVRLSLIHI